MGWPCCKGSLPKLPALDLPMHTFAFHLVLGLVVVGLAATQLGGTGHPGASQKAKSWPPQVQPLHFGVGCDFSNYSAIQHTQGSSSKALDNSSLVTSSVRFLHEPGLGKGLFEVSFKRFHLPPNDVVIVRAKNADRRSRNSHLLLSGSHTSEPFFTQPVYGDAFVIELVKRSRPDSVESSFGGTGQCFGFEIDGYRFQRIAEDDPSEETIESTDGNGAMEADQAPEKTLEEEEANDESLCGVDESQDSACFQQQAPIFQATRGVARLTISKGISGVTAYCTGFLLGCEGHLITNQHCIRDWLDAMNTVVEFYSESKTCGGQGNFLCPDSHSCPGSMVVRSTSLVSVSQELDYALVKLGDANPTALAQQIGYLQMRSSGAKLGEGIYIAHHPLGGGMRISTVSNGSPGVVQSMTTDTCGDSDDIGYYLDTEEGSSGAPVIATADHHVVALHHCGGCPNGGVRVEKIIADLTSRGVLPGCTVAS